MKDELCGGRLILLSDQKEGMIVSNTPDFPSTEGTDRRIHAYPHACVRRKSEAAKIWCINASPRYLNVSYYIERDGKAVKVGPDLTLIGPMEVIQLGLGAAGWARIHLANEQ